MKNTTWNISRKKKKKNRKTMKELSDQQRESKKRCKKFRIFQQQRDRSKKTASNITWKKFAICTSPLKQSELKSCWTSLVSIPRNISQWTATMKWYSSLSVWEIINNRQVTWFGKVDRCHLNNRWIRRRSTAD